MKTVVSKEEVARLWMEQAQSFARDRNNSLFFDGSTIYSYGRHFPIARHVINDKGDKAIVFTTLDYSVSTARHKGLVYYAIPCDYKVFRVALVTALDRQIWLIDLQEQIDRLVSKISRARIYKAQHLAMLNNYIIKFNACAAFLGTSLRAKEPTSKWINEQYTAQKAYQLTTRLRKTA